MTKLSVNLNKIALLRNQRDIGIPSVLESAKTVIEAGAHGVTVHPRPDERHIRYDDARQLKKMVTVEFNIEGNPFTGKLMELLNELKPDQATLVPDEPGANTSDHGWNMRQNKERLEPVIKQLKDLGIRVSLFMDPDTAGIQMVKEIGADRIELYTEPYARAFRTNDNVEQTIEQFADAARFANEIGLGLNAGHDLNLKNLGKFCSTVPGILEVSIGHGLIADAIEMGLENTVKEYLKVLAQN
ncbi:MAG: pyridoxine 5'-phosphate synthase [Phycisphaerae bacterium]|nr:pyridoxine 5'-phosphate synthase [Phycisphaerae bacterium]NIP50415.1 pyridoxine 5'-phosphate synthase [Phycisphaerae bacterium]NIS53479.1 pyridoxine 5'-phosphate synthase [Phycisphaerae bacterium]NIU10981.1 pyridoxine 5'-phosphate synthase [Phycisphaerae bacterium]NIU58837.1 pyridoxine 5'-phosphate synthase [Phycisphaerae bacterium]